ncbi:MAG: EamA family transporter [bacterium]|nr:EamA family transporter [bacterium]
MAFIIIVLIILVRTAGDICFKYAVNKLNLTSVSKLGANVRSMAFNPFLWAGLILGISNMILWCFSLNRFDLSYAYPFLSISYITVILSGKFLFNEHLDKNKIIGILFITTGALVLFI